MPLPSLAAALLLGLTLLSAQGSSGLGEGLLFYLDFNQGLTPRTAIGGSEVLASFKPTKGVFGEAVEVSEPIAIPLIKNLEPKKGAVSFRIRFVADLGSVDSDLALFDGTEHIRLRWFGKQKALCLMTGAAIPEVGFRWQYGSVSAGRDWKSGEWHQVVLQWDAAAGTKSIWLDGKSAYETKTEFINPGYTGNKTMSLGQKNLALAFDEFCVWNRNLSSEEVAILFKQGLGNVTFAPLASRKNEKPPLRIDPMSWKSNPSAVILRKGETISLPVRLSNRSGENFSRELTFRLVDLWGNELGAKTVPIRLAKSAFTQIEIPWTAGEDGAYKCVTRLAGENTNFDLDCGSFAVLDRAASPSNRDSFFGHHVNSWDKGIWLDQAARLGMAWMRGHNMLQSTWWIRVQPEPGAFQFAKQAEGFEWNAERGMSVLGQFFGVPAWAAQNEAARESAGRYPNGWVPKWDAFAIYVRETAKAYKGRIKYWELGNEPEVSIFWKGSPEEFAEYCRIAYREAKAANPDCVIMSAGNTTPPRLWHEAAARAGAWKWCDVMSIHMNFLAKKTTAEAEAEYLSVLEHFRSLAVQYGPTGKALPIWNSETGYSDSPWLINLDPDIAPLDEELPDQLDSRHGAIATIQGEILQQAMGVERHFVYYQNIPGKPSVGEDSHCLEYTGAPRPKTIARAVLDRMLAGAKPVGPYVKRAEAGLWAFAWEWPNQNGCLTALWSEKGSRLEIATPESAKTLHNLMGNVRELKASLEVSEEPRYLQLSISAKEALAYFQKMPVKVLEKSAPLAASSAEDKPKVPVLPAYPGPDEAGPSRTFFVDLSRVANFGFADEKPGDRQGGWTDEGPLNDFRDFPTGFQRFYNVPFKIIDPAKNEGRSILTLYGKNATPSQPRAVSNIAIGGKVRALYFLHAAGWGTPGKIGTYRMTYADGTTATLEQEIPIHNHNWWNAYDAKELSRPVPILIKNTATGKPEWRYARIYEWQNPSVENPIVSLSVESAGGAQTPVLIAVTGIRW